MSIIIKGVDLPNCSNEDCIVVIRKDKAEVWQTGFKERTVEAIQIPKDHGRLIDVDKIVKEYYRNPTYPSLCTILNNAPTILEAEGKR